jgi:hypothetical protein
MAQPGFPKWIWAMGAAAALLLAIFAGQVLGKHSIRRVPTRAVHNRGIRTDRTVLYEASASYDDQSDIDDSVFLSGSSGFPNGSGGFPDNEAVALSNDGFITVPYSPPLAPGEMVRVVHTDLYPESLASMGVEVDPAWTGELPADVAVGEDGLPRAVRITGNGQNY